VRRVILESPYAGDVEANVAYARACLRDCLERGEAPIASHLLYTQPGVLEDGNPFERKWGIDAGLVWSEQAEAAVFYLDRGWSAGMRIAKAHHLERGITVEDRLLPGYVAPCEADRQLPPEWLDVTVVGGSFEVQMDARDPNRLVCRHRRPGEVEWRAGRPPHA
jgi:hypothetical protein